MCFNFSVKRLQRYFLVDFAYSGKVYFGIAVVGKEAVDLLLHVSELRVTEALDGTATQQGFYEGLIAFEELIGVGDDAVAPAIGSALLGGVGDAAELGYEDWFAPVGVDWAVRRLCGDGRLGGRVAPSQGFGVTIVVDRAQVGDCVFPAVVGDDGPGRI